MSELLQLKLDIGVVRSMTECFGLSGEYEDSLIIFSHKDDSKKAKIDAHMYQIFNHSEMVKTASVCIYEQPNDNRNDVEQHVVY